ncbi:MAG: chloride channel protein [Planctomycetota bacterium]|jgi:CIC family chloride channel protein|nr:chloride channel protein [Planctomycetota bacterium]
MNASRSLRYLVSKGLRVTAAKWLVLGGVVGVLCGVAGLVFYIATDVGAHLVLTRLAGYHPALPKGESHLLHSEGSDVLRWWWLLLALPLGGLISGLIVSRFAPDCKGAGTEAAVHAYHHSGGFMKISVPITKFIASVVTLASGGSAGREGPIAMVGAGFASWFAQRLGLSSRDRRILLAAGIAGGVAAIFRAPLAGALFAAEVLYSDPDVEADALIPGFISAIVGFVTFGALEGMVLPELLETHLISSLFLPPANLNFAPKDAIQLVGYLAVALCTVVMARVMVFAVQRSERGFDALPMPNWSKPALGGLLTAVLALATLGASWWLNLVPEGNTTALATLGAGYGILQQAMDGGVGVGGTAVSLLLLVMVGKLATTCATVCSGGSGGLFGPTIVIGGCVGGAVGFALQGTPVAPPTSACVIMGMAGFFSATYKVPIAALLMVSEMTGNYELLLPAMWVCAISYLLSGQRGIVHSQVESPVASPAHRGHFFSDVLGGIRVSEVFHVDNRPALVLHPDSSIDECKQMVADSHQTVYPVVDASGHLTGIFNLNDLRGFLFDDSLALVAVAQDVALPTRDIIAITPNDTLATALRSFTHKNLEEIPVVDDKDRTAFLGLLTRREVIAYYNTIVGKLQAQRREEGWGEDSGGRETEHDRQAQKVPGVTSGTKSVD